MRIVTGIGLILLIAFGCSHRIETVAGVYEMARFGGKPLPFNGVRGGELHLMADGTLVALTQRAVRIGQAESQSDTVSGNFGVEAWSGECITIWIRVPQTLGNSDAFGEVCGKELVTFYDGGVFRKKASGG